MKTEKDSARSLSVAAGSASLAGRINDLLCRKNACGISANEIAKEIIECELWQRTQLKADMFDYLCWLEDFCCYREAALDGKAGDYLVTASDGTTCWGKTYAEAVRVAMEHDKELQDATSSPNVADEPRGKARPHSP